MTVARFRIESVRPRDPGLAEITASLPDDPGRTFTTACPAAHAARFRPGDVLAINLETAEPPAPAPAPAADWTSQGCGE